MAEQRISLFGLTPDQVRMARQQQAQKRQDELFSTNLAGVKGDIPGFATGYVIGGNIGRGLGQAVTGLFGQELKDPELERATKMQSLVKEFEGMDFNDPATLQRIAVRMQEAGLYEESMNVFDRSLAIQTKQAELGAKNKKKYNSLSYTDITKISSIAENVQTSQEFLDTWDDNFVNPYPGFIPGGGSFDQWVTNQLNMGDAESQARANWWKNYQAKKNQIRNALFGGALTRTEKTEFEKADITLEMTNPTTIKNNLARQAELAKKGWQRLSRALVLAGYDPNVVKSLSGDSIEAALRNERVQEALQQEVERDSVLSNTTSKRTLGPLKDGYNFEENLNKAIFSDSYENL